jgi:hypothetical protein
MHDQAHDLSYGRIYRTYDVLAHMPTIVSFGRTRAAFHPALTGSWIPLETYLIAKKQFNLFNIAEFGELREKCFALLEPFVPIRWLGKRTRNAPGVVLLVNIAKERAVTHHQFLVVFDPPTEGDESPMLPIC